MDSILKKFDGDRWIWFVVILLSVISISSIYSSTGTLAYKESKDTFYYLIKHGVFIITGLFIVYIMHKIDYKYFSKISIILLWVSGALLVWTLFFGTKVNDASRWITLPVINQTFQTSDLAKLALFMHLARILSKSQEKILDFKTGFFPILLSVVIVCSLIAPANLSTALMIFGTSMFVLLIGRVSVKQMFFVFIAGVLMVSFVVMFGPRKGVYKARVETYFNPELAGSDKSYQSDQAKIAISTGGFFGKGPGNSVQRNFLPSPYADFIYSIIIEEYGLVGGLVVLFLYLFFLYRVLLIIINSDRAFEALLAVALGFSLVIQAFSNMAVATNLFPVTGVSLPLVSMGGTSILFTSIAFGIVLSVSKKQYERERLYNKS